MLARDKAPTCLAVAAADAALPVPHTLDSSSRLTFPSPSASVKHAAGQSKGEGARACRAPHRHPAGSHSRDTNKLGASDESVTVLVKQREGFEYVLGVNVDAASPATGRHGCAGYVPTHPAGPARFLSRPLLRLNTARFRHATEPHHASHTRQLCEPVENTAQQGHPPWLTRARWGPTAPRGGGSGPAGRGLSVEEASSWNKWPRHEHRAGCRW
eukprot:scaffold132053_cov69-Phaeocystis_antarctica.AAC.1